jgi:hypothetical protein
VTLLGCGASAPRQPGQRPPTALERAQLTHEYPSSFVRQRAAGGARGAAAAVVAFATAYINWDAQSVTGDMRTLAAGSVGQARSAMQLAAAETASDYELERGGIANRGSIEAVAQLRGRRDEYVVVTRELTTATATTAYQGLQPAWHVAVASVVQERPGVWVISGWQPES